MSYAYFQGHEAKALAFYQKLLEVEKDAEARKNLAILIEKLQKIVAENQPQEPQSPSLQNASELAWLSAS